MIIYIYHVNTDFHSEHKVDKLSHQENKIISREHKDNLDKIEITESEHIDAYKIRKDLYIKHRVMHIQYV